MTKALVPHCRLIDRIAYGYYPTRKVLAGANRVFRFGDRGNQWLTGLKRHAQLRDLQAMVSPEEYSDLFKFGFVRNPWDREVSFYYYLRGAWGITGHAVARELGFEEFLRRRLENRPQGQIEWLNNADGSFGADYVGYFENLEDDMQHICRQVGIKAPVVPRENISRKRADRDYRSLYTDETAALVARAYPEDIDKFGYVFDGRR